MNESKTKRGRNPKTPPVLTEPPLHTAEGISQEGNDGPGVPGIPPCPEGSSEMGDKDPAVVLWWFTHHPEQATKRYGHRRGKNLELYQS